MRRTQLQHEALKSLSNVGRTPPRRSRSALFVTPTHVRAQQRRTFQWTGAIPTKSLVDRPLRKPEIHEEQFAAQLAEEPEQEVDTREQEAEPWEEAASVHVTLYNVKPFSTPQEADKAVRDALIRGLPGEDILYVFLRACRTDDYLRTLEQPFLKSVWEVIQPQKILARFRDAHRILHPGVLRKADERDLQDLFGAYTHLIRSMLRNPSEDGEGERWRSKMLLQLARVTGDAASARTVVEVMKNLDAQGLDTAAYNDYLTAMCWENAWTSNRMSLRVHPWALNQREERQTHPRWTGYRIRNGGIKEQALKTIRQMQDDGCECDAETWSMLIIALAREGDMEGVAATLRRVWDVDVRAVMRQDERGMLFENRLTPASPLHPTSETLFAIAHAFCINNEVAGALKVVDYVSRKYDIPVPQSVWEELLEWAYVLSRRRREGQKNPERLESERTGSIPMSTVDEIWNTMLGPPYGIRPDTSLYSIVCHNAITRGDYWRAIAMFLEANRSVLETRRRGRAASNQQGPIGSEVSAVQRLGDNAAVSRMIRTLLAQRPERLPEFAQIWPRNIIPDLLARCRWLEKINWGFAYRVPAGYVQINPSSFTVKMSRVEQPDVGLVVHQTPPVFKADPYLTYTRQRRMQVRQSRQGRGRQKESYQPSWFESEKVTNWTPPAPKLAS